MLTAMTEDDWLLFCRFSCRAAPARCRYFFVNYLTLPP